MKVPCIAVSAGAQAPIPWSGRVEEDPQVSSVTNPLSPPRESTRTLCPVFNRCYSSTDIPYINNFRTVKRCSGERFRRFKRHILRRHRAIPGGLTERERPAFMMGIQAEKRLYGGMRADA